MLRRNSLVFFEYTIKVISTVVACFFGDIFYGQIGFFQIFQSFFHFQCFNKLCEIFARVFFDDLGEIRDRIVKTLCKYGKSNRFVMTLNVADNGNMIRAGLVIGKLLVDVVGAEDIDKQQIDPVNIASFHIIVIPEILQKQFLYKIFDLTGSISFDQQIIGLLGGGQDLAEKI